MSTQQNTLEIIGAILSFKSATQLLKFTLQEENFNWDAIVKIGSRHLVLPAIYCRLKEKQLLNCLPEDLLEYLEEITTINRNRNLEILNEVNEISQLFNNHHIDHVFLKGTALLAGNYYKDLGERMVGDIDVLVASNQVQEAYELIKTINYGNLEDIRLRATLFESRHLPRLVKKTALAAIEIHKEVLKKPYFNYLIPSEILKNKRVVQGISIPLSTHLLEHNVLNLQINDLGNYYNYLNFRMAYDTCLILREHPTINIQSNYSTPIFDKYFLRHSLFFKEINFKPTSLKTQLYLALFKFKIKHLWYFNMCHGFLFYIDYTKFLLNRSRLFILNKDYRSDILTDRKRVYREHKKKLFN
ncbi:Uncharacterised nucleotidyltransferase [Lutibacter agarilyticus]|uniref:Uncharacterized nucleotidyltransferase n=1 Tax=Lutibacter agarilyticus TaxID=1109740 RepID=A0A238V6H7_9FLAO|nr:nucleotidyltransferase family protein [Lutibacter agarilyticus]SNR30035.1 Uncharacterised nucleotidyltransferase [Lutibacter agarilyticus]